MVEVGKITAVIDGDISALKTALEQGKAAATQTAKEIESKPIKIKSQIDNSSVSGGLSSFMGADKGKFANVGKEMGQSLQMGMQQQFGMMGGMVSSVAGALGPAGMVAGAAIAGGAVIASAAVNAAKAWETLFAGVGKTTGLKKGTDEFNALSDSLLKLSQTAGMGTQESLAAIAQKAGSQGIGSRAADAGNYALQREQILAYTKDVQGMATAFDMTAEDSATMGAAVQKSFKLPMDEIHHMGSMVTTVGDSIGVEEKNILEFLSRAGGSKVATNEGVTKTAAFGAALMSTGMQAEVAASSITMLESQVLSNDSKMTTWAKTLGVTKDQLWQMTKTDFYGTVLKTGDLMSKMDISKSIPLGTEIFGAEVAKYINKMGGVGDDYYRGIEKGNAAFAEGTRLAEVFGEKGATVDSKWQAFSNTMNTAFIHLGTTALPIIGQIIDAMTGMVSGADAFGQKLGKVIDVVSGKAKETTGYTGGGAGFTAEKGGLLDRLGLGGEWIIGDEEGNIRRKTAEELQAVLPAMTDTMDGTMNTAGNMAGTAYGDALGAALKTKIPLAVSEGYLALGGLGQAATDAGAKAGDKFGDGFLTSLKDKKISEALGALIFDSSGNIQMSDMSALNIINSQSRTGDESKNIVKTLETFFGKYYVQKRVANDEATYASGEATLLDEAGKVIITKAFAEAASGGIEFDTVAKDLEDSIKPVFLDMPKFMQSASSEMSGLLANILSDGVVQWEEKDQLKSAIKQLDSLEKLKPIEFELANLDEKRTELKAALDGINVDINLDKNQLAYTFTKYLAGKADLVGSQRKAGEAGYPVLPMREDFQQQYDYLKNLPEDKKSDQIREALDDIEKAATTGDPEQIAIAMAAKDRLEEIAPELGKMTWFMNDLNTVQYQALQQGSIVKGELVLIRTSTDGTTKSINLGFQDEVVWLRLIADGINNFKSSTTYISPTEQYNIINNFAAADRYASGKPYTMTRMSRQESDAYLSYGNMGYGSYSYKPFYGMTASQFAKGGLTNGAELFLAGEAGQELILPLSDPARTRALLKAYLPIKAFAKGGLTMSDSLASWGGQPGASSGMIGSYNPNQDSAQWHDVCTGACKLTDLSAKNFKENVDSSIDDWNGGIDISMGKTLETFDTIATKQLQTSANWISSSPYKATGTAQSGSIDKAWLGYNANEEKFYRKAPDWVTKDIQMGRTTKETYAKYASEYKAATDEIERMNAALNGYKEDYINCYDTMSQFGISQELDTSLTQGTYIGVSGKAYEAWVANGKRGDVGPSPYSEMRNAITGNAAGRAFRETGDISGVIAASAFGKISEPIVYAVGESAKSISGSIEEGVVDWGDSVDVLADGIRETIGPDDIMKMLSGGAKNVGIGSDLLGAGAQKANTPWYLTEFDQYIASAESGLGSCIESLSDFAIMQEGVMESDLFKPGYIGATDRTGPNYLATFPTAGPFMAEAIRRGMPGTKTEEVSGMAGNNAYTYDPETGLSVLQKSADSAKGTETNTKGLLNTANNILATSKDANLIAMANAVIGMGGGSTMGGGSNLLGGGGGGDWFSAASSRYGSTFNDWISGGAAGVGLFANEPKWFTDALKKAIGNGGVIGDVNTGRGIVRTVERSGGSYGGWVPAFADEGYVDAPTLAMIGDRPGGEYVVGAARFEEAAAKMGRGGMVVNHTINIQGNADSSTIDAIHRENKQLLKDIEDLMARGL